MNTWPNPWWSTRATSPSIAVPGDGLRFENVGFRYPGASRAALEGIDLHLVPGHSLALVGENGSGKTTLIKLLTRLYRPDQGRILLMAATCRPGRKTHCVGVSA